MIDPGLHALLGRASLPDGLALGACPSQDSPGRLFPEERSAMDRARATRRGDFVAGRLAARQALAGLGHTPCAIPVGADRAPIWPDGIAGSISHAGGMAVAIVGQAAAWAGLGIDLERRTDVEPDTAAMILRPEETGADALSAFSAKEAIFKAQFPATGVWLDYQAAVVAPDLGSARFAATAQTATLPDGWRKTVLPLRQWHGDGWILTLCAVPSGICK